METYRGMVQQWETDHMGHMNVQFYVAKFDSATWQLFGAVGMTPGWFRKHRAGMAAVEQAITYRAELLAGALVVVRSAVLAVTTRSLRFRHIMTDCETGEEAATTELVAVHLDLTTRTSRPFPDVIRQRAAELIEPEG